MKISKCLILLILHHVSFFTGNLVEPLYFPKGTEKGTAVEDIKDPYGHFFYAQELYFKGNYLKLKRSQNLTYKKIPNPSNKCTFATRRDI